MQAKVSEWNNLLGLRTTDYIVISKSKSVLHSAFQSYSFISHCTLRSPLRQSYRVLSFKQDEEK